METDPERASHDKNVGTVFDIIGKDGNTYHVRPIQASDAASLMRGYDAMSDKGKWVFVCFTPYRTCPKKWQCGFARLTPATKSAW